MREGGRSVKGDPGNKSDIEIYEEDEETIICRCEDITLAEIKRVVAEGYITVEEIKRKTRLSMGPCQGRTCLQLISAILARELDRDQEEIDLPVSRPPLEGVELGVLAARSGGGESDG